jgi:hypothetical protein
MLTNSKNGPFIVPYHSVLICVDSWPFIKLKREIEHLTLQKWAKLDSLFQQHWEILSEEEETDVIILVLDDVVDDGLNGS